MVVTVSITIPIVSFCWCGLLRVMVAEAVAVIESWWWRTKNRRVFRILKETIRSAVSSNSLLFFFIACSYVASYELFSLVLYRNALSPMMSSERCVQQRLSC